MKKSINNIKLNKLIIVGALFCFLIIIARVSFLAMSTVIDGINIKEFAESRSVVNKTISADRGSIYDVNGDILSQNVSSYTLIAYIDPVRSEGEKKLYHVADKESTAASLSKVINLSYEEILEILNQDGLYQVEFGIAGKNLTEIEKDKIVDLNLPGIDFIEKTKRYYPNGDFASYVVGYAKPNEDGEICGELGIEQLLDETLSGTDGYISYQKDLNGYQIAGTDAIETKAKDGDDIYLTIDSNIQLFVEQALNAAVSKYGSEWMVVTVADAETGAILGSSQKPSYDPNVLDISNYLDLTVAQPYEPGSIMKIYTYMAALEAGTYDGKQTFKSGQYITDDGTVIKDWQRGGFGTITFDQGFMASSNVGVINIMNRFINKKVLLEYFKKMGFGTKTGITLANEMAGKVTFNYQTEVYTAAFGQGITTTPMQHIQALTAIANDGVMLQPYIIDKIVDEEGKVIYEGKKTEIATVASKSTTDYMRELMYQAVNSTWVHTTGNVYKMDGYDLIGKTGTSQLVNATTGNYYTDNVHAIKSFVGMWPKNDPKVIIYASVKKPQYGSSKGLRMVVDSVVENVSKYLNIFGKTTEDVIKNYTVENYINKETSVVTTSLAKAGVDYILIGDGTKIINQYPEVGSLIDSNEQIILLTNGSNYKLPNLIGYSKTQARAICDILDLSCTFKGYGYVTNQSIAKNKVVKAKDKLTLTLNELYNISE